jgi:integrase/recombinase XerC
MSSQTPRAGRSDLEAALLLIGKLGVTPADLVAATAAARPVVPTFAQFIPQVAAATSEGTLKAYGPYWKRIVQAWGGRRLDEPTPLEIEQLGKQIRAERVQRRNGRGGASSEENFVAAIRRVYRRAVANGYITDADNPAAKVAKPRRQPSHRRAIVDTRLTEIHQAAASSGDDPELDALLLRIHEETACRRGGALNLRLIDLDQEQCLIRLREKANSERWQPVSPTLMTALLGHATERGSPASGRLLRYRDGTQLTYRRYDGLWQRIGQILPWVAVQGISTHWIRHTTLTWVERHFGYAVARAYAGHNDRGGSQTGSTTTYIRADVQEVASALSALTGEPHPLTEYGQTQLRS